MLFNDRRTILATIIETPANPSHGRNQQHALSARWLNYHIRDMA